MRVLIVRQLFSIGKSPRVADVKNDGQITCMERCVVGRLAKKSFSHTGYTHRLFAIAYI